MTRSQSAPAVDTTSRKVASWPASVAIHSTRLLRRWRRSPAILLAAIGMPIMMMVTIIVMFRGMIEQFTGQDMNLAGIAVMIAVSSMLTGALMGAGSTVRGGSRLDGHLGHRSGKGYAAATWSAQGDRSPAIVDRSGPRIPSGTGMPHKWRASRGSCCGGQPDPVGRHPRRAGAET